MTKKPTNKDQGIAPKLFLENIHTKNVNDVMFSPCNHNVLGTASDDGHYKIWDLRTLSSGNFTHTFKASEEDLLCISFNNHNEHIFATGGESTGVIKVWDLRMPRTFLNDLNFHQDKVNCIEWSP